jgi:class 3 adenylate cyclase
LVDDSTPNFAAEIYKTYLTCAARIIKCRGGTITAYVGDRIMAVFLGDHENTTAVEVALKINGAAWDVINPALERQYSNSS